MPGDPIPIGGRVDLGELCVQTAGASVVGRRYAANYDVLHVDPLRPVIAVADGMGDGPGSRFAGRTAMDTFVAELIPCVPGPATLRAAAAVAQRRVLDGAAAIPGLAGCTLTALVATETDGAWIVHLGDSRVYRLRAGLVELLTVDHTAAWLGAVYGWYAPDSPRADAARYHLHRYVGHPEQPEPDLLNLSLRPGDRYLVCTDGVAEQLTYQRLSQWLASDRSPEEVVAGLVADTLTAGGRDNATAALLRVETGGG